MLIGVSNPNVPIFPPIEGLHFSAFNFSVCLSVCHAILAERATKSITIDTILLSVRFAAILK